MASLPPLMRFLSSRLFSLQVPLPPKLFLSMVYKFEGSTDVQVALELTTGDASSCHVGGISVLNGERLGNFMERRWRGPWLGVVLVWVELVWVGLLWVGMSGYHLGSNLWFVVTEMLDRVS